MDELRLLSETELRKFHLNEKTREAYIAHSLVAGASIILDWSKKEWFEPFNIDQMKRESPSYVLATIAGNAWRKDSETAHEFSMALGLESGTRTTVEALSAAWIEEISRRQTKKFGRALFNL